MNCPECNAKMVLRVTSKFLTRDKQPRKFYGCSRYPECKATHGAHPNGQPLGIPATPEVKELRMKAHRLLETKFGEWKTISGKQKEVMYLWLKQNTQSGHIGKMGKEELLDLITYLQQPTEH